MSTRSSMGYLAVAAALSWLSLYDRPAVRENRAAVQEPVVAAIAPPPQRVQASASRAPTVAPRAPRAPAPARPLEPVQPLPGPDVPNEAVDIKLRAERDVFNAARELAVTKAKLRMETEPIDEQRTDDLRRQYGARFDEGRFGVRPEVRCVASMCKVRVETGDAVALAQVDQIHSDLGLQPLTTVDGDPAQGIIRSVSFYVIGDEVMHELVGSDTRGILTPAPL